MDNPIEQVERGEDHCACKRIWRMKAPRAHLGALWVSDSRAGTLYRIDLDGKVTVVAALITEVKYQPPYWVHAALWIPLILIVTLWPLRGLKSLLISLQYHHKAS